MEMAAGWGIHAPFHRTIVGRTAIAIGIAVFVCLAADRRPCFAGEGPVIASDADLAKLVAKFDRPETRMQAVSDLLAFIGFDGEMIDTGDAHLNELHNHAFTALKNCPQREAVVDTFVERLNHDETRMALLSDLLIFAGNMALYQDGFSLIWGGSGDPEFDRLRRRAATAVYKYVNVDTIGKSLDSRQGHVLFWAVRSFPNDLEPAAQAPWVPLLPKLEKAAVEGDANIRDVADETLAVYPQEHDFLDKRVEAETSADVLMRLVRTQQVSATFERRLFKLLNHPDENVRRDALLFIGSNSNRATMWQFRFDSQIFDRVVQLTHTKSAAERGDAAFALTDIRKRNLDGSRKAFLALVGDTSSDVRWRLASGLVDQLDRADVKPAIDKLLKDPVPLVRYMTICAVGAEKHRPELQQLTMCDDKQVAADAMGKLKQLDDAKGGVH